MEREPNTFAAAVGRLIDRAGIPQAELERRIGLGKGTLSKWRSEEVGMPRQENLSAFAEALRLSPEERATLFKLAGYRVEISRTLDSAEFQDARARYLAALRERYGVIETHAFTALAEDERVGQPLRLPLLGEHGVYVALTFDAAGAREEVMLSRDKRAREMQERAGKALSLAEVLRLPGHLAVIGDAGSGKTTVLHVLVSLLAAEHPAALDHELAAALPQPRPLPVLLPLRFFEHACNAAAAADYARCSADLLRFVDTWFAQWCPEAQLPVGFLEAHIRAGRAWFLLDALDEVADASNREAIRNVIEGLARSLNGARLIVTARIAAYRATSLNQDFTVVTVRDLEPEQRTRLAHTIYRGLALPDATARAADLATRLEANAALQALARTPVMIWTTAVIHALRGELPEGRAALYDAYVDILLKKSFERTRYDTAALDALTDGLGWTVFDRRHYLTYMAFQTHALLEAQTERRGDTVIVGEDELVDEILKPYFAANLNLTPRDARRRAQEFVALMVERSGLLYETAGGYRLGDHLTMQEFLAAFYLAENYADEDPEGYAAFFRERARRTWWREVVLLAAGYLGQKPGFQGQKFLRRLVQAGEKSGWGLAQLRVGRKRPDWYGGLAQEFANQLYARLYAAPADAPAAQRQEAALALGLLHGYPEEDAAPAPGAGVPDPRFFGPLGLPAFAKIPAGTFWMGSTEEEAAHWIQLEGKDYAKDELPRHRVTLSAYEVAKYPTTNAMFARFIAADGYANPDFWEEAIVVGDWKEGQVNTYVEGWQNTPRYWNDSRWNNPAQPVVGVNWYEAVAYCRWLTATLKDGYEYRLPTEAEWERAARGPEGRAYPWGDEWREGACNSKDVGLEATSPVGLFPAGASFEGIEDLAGNVWEWCADWYGPYQSKEPGEKKYRVLRGGSWYHDGPPICRCGCRIWYNPGGGYNDRGFRCVRASPLKP